MTREELIKDQFPNDEFLQSGVLRIVNKCTADLEKENAELKKNYEDSLVACGVLKEKIDILSKPSPVEAMQDVLITTQKEVNKKQRDKLTKAKFLLKQLVDAFPKSYSDVVKDTLDEAKNFLKEIE